MVHLTMLFNCEGYTVYNDKC